MIIFCQFVALSFILFKVSLIRSSFFSDNCIYLFLTTLGHGYSAQAFSSCGDWGLLCCGAQFLIAVASLIGEHGLQGTQPSGVAARGLSSCSSWALEHGLSGCGCTDLVAWQHAQSPWTRIYFFYIKSVHTSFTTEKRIVKTQQNVGHILFFSNPDPPDVFSGSRLRRE